MIKLKELLPQIANLALGGLINPYNIPKDASFSIELKKGEVSVLIATITGNDASYKVCITEDLNVHCSYAYLRRPTKMKSCAVLNQREIHELITLAYEDVCRNKKTQQFPFNQLAQKIYQANKAKGFWDKERNVGEALMLINTELGEAMQAHQKGNILSKEAIQLYLKEAEKTTVKPLLFKNAIKDCFQDEIADAIIRLFDFAGGFDIDLDFHIPEKLEYNKSRERLHGKKY